MEDLVKRLREAGYQRSPRKCPSFMSQKEWSSIDKQALGNAMRSRTPVHHMRINEHTERGLHILAQRWGTRTHARTIARAVEECLRSL
jgi:hypothetical protein